MIDLVQGWEYDVLLPSLTTDDGRTYENSQFRATYKERRVAPHTPQSDDVKRKNVTIYVFCDRLGKSIEVEEPHLSAAHITPIRTPNTVKRVKTIRSGGPDKLTKDDDPLML
mgnify:CR=1 FL=1